jgi:nitroreductase
LKAHDICLRIIDRGPDEVLELSVMDVLEAVDSRIACRAFLDKPVDLEIVRELIVRAQRAASGGNLQSWNVYALANEPLADFKRIVAERIAHEDPRHAKSEYPIYPEPMFERYKERREAHGAQLYGSLGIAQTDAAGRLLQYKKNFEFFNAPVALVHHHRQTARAGPMGRPRRLYPHAGFPRARLRLGHMPAGVLGAALRHCR